MSYIGTPMNVTSPANLIGASFVDVQNESLGPSVDGATAVCLYSSEFVNLKPTLFLKILLLLSSPRFLLPRVSIRKPCR
ncbi:hypothetical protein B9Z55_010448 [Caenorhabditis nigoni]|uniref:Uncharacterized protein n=1 Tax=Caenorhabditis nigoni TaxID=1611254 RepID=A0A2G5UFV3_9PELO|nr:hypothetical protein B9Z55_010448 [Caenorhabditis nigoni]